MRAISRRMVQCGAMAPMVVVALLAGEARAQAEAPFVVGSRVRIQAPAAVEGRVEGIVMEVDESSVLISADERVPLRISKDAITRLDVATGRRRQTLKGTLIGASIGAGALALVPRDEYCADLAADETCPSKAGIVATGAAGGAIWGAVFGLLVKTDRWGSVPLEHVHVTVAPVRGRGVGLTLSASW